MTVRTAVVIAVGPLGRGKSRLGPTLDPLARRQLVLAMLDDVLRAVRVSHDGLVVVVTPDAEVDPLATTHGAAVVRDEGRGTNAAIVQALADRRVRASDAALVLQGDLPQLTGAQVAQLLSQLDRATPPMALLVPGDDGGTSALGLRPVDALRTAFGPQSGAAHHQAADAAGIRLDELWIDELAADVDTTDDLERVRALVGPSTAAVLERIAVGAGGSEG